jgi:hypothetical protein
MVLLHPLQLQATSSSSSKVTDSRVHASAASFAAAGNHHQT